MVSRSTYTTSKFFYEILELGPPVNAPAHYRSPIFMYRDALRPHGNFQCWFIELKKNIKF